MNVLFLSNSIGYINGQALSAFLTDVYDINKAFYWRNKKKNI